MSEDDRDCECAWESLKSSIITASLTHWCNCANPIWGIKSFYVTDNFYCTTIFNSQTLSNGPSATLASSIIHRGGHQQEEGSDRWRRHQLHFHCWRWRGRRSFQQCERWEQLWGIKWSRGRTLFCPKNSHFSDQAIQLQISHQLIRQEEKERMKISSEQC